MVEGSTGMLHGSGLGASRDRLLLAILAAAAGAVVHRDVLIEQLWGPSPPLHPHRALSTSVSRLRRSLRPDDAALRSASAGYALDCGTDLDELDRAIGAGRFEAALDLLSAGFLAGEGDAEWIDAQRRDIERRRIELMIAAGRQSLSDGRLDAAATRFTMAIQADPLREDAHRGLMESLAMAGRDAEALRAYEHCRRSLSEALGALPSPDTTRLYGQLLRGADPSPPRQARPGVGVLPFLGRRRELTTLRSLLADPWPADLILVVGEAGIGKTRLVAEALEHLVGIAPLRAKCFELTASVPYALVDDLLGDARPQAGATEARLAADVAERFAQRVPLVVFVDDLHWADASSLRVLGLALHRLAGGPMTIIGTLREEEANAGHHTRLFVDLARRVGSYHRLELGPLPPEDLEAGGFTREDWERTGGHPLFLAEHARGAGRRDLAAAVTERAARLGPAATETLAATAVLDRPATLVDLAAVTGLSLPDVRAAAAALGTAALLRERGGTWRVAHDLVAALVRESLDERARRALHRRALSLLSGTSPGEQARHALKAGEWQRAVDFSLVAGDEALAAFADQEALGHFRTGLEIAEQHLAGSPEQRFRLAIGCARALLVQGKGNDAQRLLTTLPEGEGRQEFERQAWLSQAVWVSWRPSAAVPPAQRALEIAQNLGEAELVGRSHGLLANSYGTLGELDRSLDHLRRALAAFEQSAREPPALVWVRLAVIQHHRGDERGALTTLARLRQSALAQRDETSLVIECWARALALGGLGRYGEALAALDEVARIGRGEEAFGRASVRNTRGWLYLDLGLCEEALDSDQEALEVTLASGDLGPEPLIHALLNLAHDQLATGDPDQAAAHLSAAERLVSGAEMSSYRFVNRLQIVRGLLCLEAGRGDEALVAAEAAAKMAAIHGAPRYVALSDLLVGDVTVRAGKREQALSHFRRAARTATRHGFAALAEAAHRRAARAADSSYHLRQADRWRAQIAASVDGTLLRPRFRDD